MPNKLTQAEFIAKAVARHRQHYNYSQVAYVTSSEKVKIICPKHGLFEQRPNAHLAGRGCMGCVKDLRRRTGSFIARAQIIHGNAYDYSQTEYTGSLTKVKIICPKHGIFEQVANTHLCGCGCAACGQELAIFKASLSWPDRAEGRIATLYLVRIFDESEQFYKVGVTYFSVRKRFKINPISHYRYELLAQHKSLDSNAIFEREQDILKTFAHIKYRPKTYFPGISECFSVSDEIIRYFLG